MTKKSNRLSVRVSDRSLQNLEELRKAVEDSAGFPISRSLVLDTLLRIDGKSWRRRLALEISKKIYSV